MVWPVPHRAPKHGASMGLVFDGCWVFCCLLHHHPEDTIEQANDYILSSNAGKR